MIFTSRQLFNILLQPELALSFDNLTLSNLIHVLRAQRLLAIFTQQALEQNIVDKFESKAKGHLLSSLVVVQRQNQQVEAEASIINHVLEDVAEHVVFLKGAAYSLAGYNFSKTRAFSDIDILVDRESIEKCEKALTEDGWIMQEISSYDDRYYRQWAHEIPPMQHATRGTFIDVHHNLIPIVSGDAPDVKLLAEYITTLDSGLSVFTPEAQFVHSAVHLLRNEDYQCSTRDLFDLYFMIKQNDPNFALRCFKVGEKIGFDYETALILKILDSNFDVELGDYRSFTPNLKKSPLRWRFDVWLMTRVLRPYHSKIKGHKIHAFYLFIAMLRGHAIKMPVWLLTYHMVVKSCRRLIEAIFGKYIFVKEEEPDKQN